MAFKMTGFDPGDGTGMNSAFKAKADRKTRKAEKLRLKAERLRERGKEGRAQAKERRAGVKEQMAENLRAGKDKKANLIDDRGGQTPGMKHRTDRPKEHDASGKKIKGTGKKSSESKASDAGTANMSFREAFRHARDAGKKTFTWRGKKYHTRTRSEEKKRTSKRNKKKDVKKVEDMMEKVSPTAHKIFKEYDWYNKKWEEKYGKK
tara:strand:- start:136 stop:753 length:618 start_codon:yes stop_codon:yes gene_type:complete